MTAGASVSDVHLALLAMAYLLTKHAIADYYLQTAYITRFKGSYGHSAGMIHSGQHAALTAPVFLFLPPATAVLGLAILAAEFIVHYHIDWLKDNIVRRNGWTQADGVYWHVMGLDQLLHGLTYIVIVWFLTG